jgi:hypothetical protein
MENQNIKNGKLISMIFEFPHEVQNVLDDESHSNNSYKYFNNDDQKN